MALLERARLGAGVLALDAASRAAGQLAGGRSVAPDDRGDLLERHAEHVVQHERDALGGRERVEDDEQREPVPSGFRLQPVDADEVAARLVELALGTPAGLVPDMAGPRVYGMAELVRGYLRARRKRRPIVPVRLPGKAARAFRGGANLAPNRAVGPGRSSWPNE